MTGLEKILNSIDDEATLLAAKTIEEAKAKAHEILTKAKKTAQEEVAKIMSNTDAKIKTIEERTDSQMVLQTREILLRAKCEMINQTIEKAKSVLCSLPVEDYFKIMETLFEKHLVPKKGEIIFSLTDLKRIPDGFKENISKLAASIGGEIEISEGTRDIDGGFVLVYGEIEENCSFEALFSSKYELLCDRMNEILFS